MAIQRIARSPTKMACIFLKLDIKLIVCRFSGNRAILRVAKGVPLQIITPFLGLKTM